MTAMTKTEVSKLETLIKAQGRLAKAAVADREAELP